MPTLGEFLEDKISGDVKARGGHILYFWAVLSKDDLPKIEIFTHFATHPDVSGDIF